MNPPKLKQSELSVFQIRLFPPLLENETINYFLQDEDLQHHT